MRTIELTEHRTRTEQLAGTELAELRRLDLVAISPRGGDWFDLKPSSVIGTVALSHLRLLIRPKASLANVMTMLSYGAGLVRWRDEPFPYERSDDLITIIAALFATELRRAHRFGPVRGYRNRRQPLETIRGCIDWGAQLSRRPGAALPVECEFQDYDEDVDLNRVLLAGIDRAGRFPELELRVRQQLRHARKLFAGVSRIEYGSADLPDVSRTPNVEAWWPAFMLARLILRSDSVRDATGAYDGASFLVDMNRLFEAFVRAVVHDECRRAGLMLAPPRTRRAFTEVADIEPDLLVTRGGQDVAVGDVKYKLEFTSIPPADRYQMFAYCRGLRLDRGLLIYADLGAAGSERVHGADVTIELDGIDLTGSPQAVLARTREVARRLVAQAQVQVVAL